MYMLRSSLLCNHKSFQIKVYFCSLLQEYYVSIGVCVCDHYHVVTVHSNYNPPSYNQLVIYFSESKTIHHHSFPPYHQC